MKNLIVLAGCVVMFLLCSYWQMPDHQLFWILMTLLSVVLFFIELNQNK